MYKEPLEVFSKRKRIREYLQQTEAGLCYVHSSVVCSKYFVNDARGHWCRQQTIERNGRLVLVQLARTNNSYACLLTSRPENVHT